MPDAKQADTPLLEWIAAGIGLLLLLALLAVIGREAVAGEHKELPAIELAVRGVAPAGAGFVVGIEATNRSGGTAAAVEIEATLKTGATTVETSGASFDYVPGHSKVAGGVFFTRDPRGYTLEVRPMGFQTP